MRARDSWLGGVLFACLCAGSVLAQGTDDTPPLQFEPYNKHHDQHFGHDHVYPDRGSVFRDAPKGSTLINYAGLSYRFSNGVWFEPRGPAFIVVMPPIGVVVPSLPAFATPLELGGESYFYANDVYYLARPELGGYEVVNDPSDMAPTPASSGGGGGGVSGESAVVKAAPLAAAVPVSATGAVVATSAMSAAPAAAGVAAGSVTPTVTTAANVAGAAPVAVARSMTTGAGVASGTTSAAGTAVPDVAPGPTSAIAPASPAVPAVAMGPTHPMAPAGQQPRLLRADQRCPALTPRLWRPADFPPPILRVPVHHSLRPDQHHPPGRHLRRRQPSPVTQRRAPRSRRTQTPPPRRPAQRSRLIPRRRALRSRRTQTLPPRRPALRSRFTQAPPQLSRPMPPRLRRRRGSPPVVPASATYTEAAKMQPVVNAQPSAAPIATAPTVPGYGAPTYGTPTSAAPTYTAATTGAAGAPPAQLPVQPVPPGVTGIPILGSASGGANLMAYPRNGQNQERQARDHYDCYQFGVAQTGYDPMRAGYGASGTGNQTEFERAQAACFEGRGYMVR